MVPMRIILNSGRLTRGLLCGLCSSTSLYAGRSANFATVADFESSHSLIDDVKLSKMHIKIIPTLSDNYMYLIIDSTSRKAAAIDPVDPELVLKEARKEKAKVSMVLCTHHHKGHACGNEKFLEITPIKPLPICGGDDRIPGMNCKILQGDRFKIGSLDVKCLYTPGHTSGHICYYIESPRFKERCIFTGDALFQGGCGRLFEGTAEQMFSAIYQKVATLPDDTFVFCGHEYTVENLEFARTVEPDNKYLNDRLIWARKRRASCETTMPSTMYGEKRWNPFLRVFEETVKQHCNQEDPVRVMTVLREERNNYKSEETIQREQIEAERAAKQAKKAADECKLEQGESEAQKLVTEAATNATRFANMKANFKKSLNLAAKSANKDRF